jgi:uncharacterized membrane protein HdeD (DUF308 family)
MKKMLKNYTSCLVLGIVFILAAILFAPIWSFWDGCPWKNWGQDIVNLLIAACIITYLVLYLSKKLTHGKRVIKVLTIVEFALLSLIALGCIFSQFDFLIKVSGACKIFGVALWTRGSIELFRAYFYRADSKEIYPVWYLGVSIAMVTLGTYCFAKPFIQDIALVWIFVSLLLALGAALLYLAFQNKKAK